jgi:hypothetical protein
MPSEALAVSKSQRLFDKCLTVLKPRLAKAIALKEEFDQCIAGMLRALRDADVAFREKSPGMPLRDGDVEYQDFKEWLTAFFAPLYKPRQPFYYLHVARNLLDRVSDEDIEEFGIEKCKDLSKYAEVKGKVPKELVEKAKACTVEELHVEVQKQLYKGNPDHEDRTGWATIEITGPRSYTTRLQNYLQLRRRTEGYKPSDAELLWLPIAIDYEELKKAEEDRRKKISGLPTEGEP